MFDKFSSHIHSTSFLNAYINDRNELVRKWQKLVRKIKIKVV